MPGGPGGEGAGAIARREAGVGGGVPGRGFGGPEEDTADGRRAGVRDLGTGGGSAEGAFAVGVVVLCFFLLLVGIVVGGVVINCYY